MADGRRSLAELEMRGDFLAALRQYDWPGNIRELENCMESAVVLSEAGRPPSSVTVRVAVCSPMALGW